MSAIRNSEPIKRKPNEYVVAISTQRVLYWLSYTETIHKHWLTLSTCCLELTIFAVFWSLAVVLAVSATWKHTALKVHVFDGELHVWHQLTFGGILQSLGAVKSKAVQKVMLDKVMNEVIESTVLAADVCVCVCVCEEKWEGSKYRRDNREKLTLAST